MELRKGYKQTEIGVIPEDWEVKKISQVCSPVRGGSPRPAGDAKYFNGDFIPWLTVGSITNATKNQITVDSTHSFLTYEGSLQSRILEKGTIIVSNSGFTLGVAKILAIKCCANDGIAALQQLDKSLNKHFFAYYFNSITNSIRKVLARGNEQINLNTQIIGGILFPLPPLPEQTAIATVLSDADNLLQALQKKIAKKRLIKQGAMQELLKPRAGWERVALKEVIEVNRGGSPRPIHDYITTAPNGVNWIKIGDTNSSSKYITSSKEKIIEEGVQNSREVKIGDFLLSNSMSFGRPYILKINGCIHDGWLVLQKYEDSFNKEFLYYTLMSKDVLNQYLTKASGSGVLNLNKELVKTVQLNRPKTLKEQIRIATILSDMDTEIENLEKKLAKYKQVKQGLMQNLLTGKVRLV